MAKIPIYECKVDESLNDVTGIYAISFVDEPAVEENFVALSKSKVILNKDTKKQILTGVVLKPNQLIYRLDEQNQPYYIQFSETEIEKISHKMMKAGLALQHTTHQHESELKDNYLIELWIVTNPENDKSNALGFKDLPKGTLMASYKVTDKSYWETEVMTGQVKGFSLEGFFNQELKLNKIIKKNKMNKHKKTSLLNKIGKFLMDIEDVQRTDATDSGENVRIYQLYDGKEVIVDEDGYCTIDNEQAPSGEHKLYDGNTLVIDEAGQFVEVKPSDVAITEPTEAVPAPVDVPNENPEQLKKKKRCLADEKTEDEENTDFTIAEDEKDKEKMEEVPAEEVDVDAVMTENEALKSKVAELEAKIAELEGTVETKDTEITEMKKVTPSVSPINPTALNATAKPFEKMTRAEQIAYTLRMSNK